MAVEPWTLRGEFEQGAVVFGKTDPKAEVLFNGRKLLLTEMGDFVFGFDRDAGPDAELSVALPGQPALVKHYSVRKREWEVQRIEGLPPKLVNPPPGTEQRIAAEAALIKAAHERDSAIDDFTESFVWPSKGRVSGVFGSQRILNGVPKQAHYGVDVAVPTAAYLWTNLASLYQHAHSLRAARIAVDQALSLDPTAMLAYETAGQIYDGLNQKELAAGLHRRAQEFLDENPYYHYQLALAALDRHDEKTAYEQTHQAVALRPQEPRFLFLQALLLARRGDSRLAEDDMQAVMDLTRGTPQQERYRNKFVRLREQAQPAVKG